MTESILVALITSAVTLAGVLAANSKAMAVMDARLDELTREVREHNHFAQRVPVAEEQIRSLRHRLESLESRRADH